MKYVANGSKIEINDSYISISTLAKHPNDAEIVYWDNQEWKDDPDLCRTTLL